MHTFGTESVSLLSFLKSGNTLFRYSQIGGVIGRKKKKSGREGKKEGRTKENWLINDNEMVSTEECGLSHSQEFSLTLHKRVHCYLNLSRKDSIASPILSSMGRHLSDYCLQGSGLSVSSEMALRTLWSLSIKLGVQRLSASRKVDCASRAGQVLESD